ncbi:MAG: hypothetical protein ABIO60_08940 [Aquaticitalea sp.]
MRKVYTEAPTGVLTVLLLALFLMNGASIYYDYQVIPNITKFISVLLFLTCYYTKQSHMANVFLTFLIFMFLGDTFTVFNFGDLAGKLSKILYMGAYSLLIFVLLGKFKRIKIEGLVLLYLILIFVLNTYFLYALYGEVKDNFSDKINLVLYICHGSVLVAMAFLAFAVYLSKESTQSILFLVMVFCFVFADVLEYICDLYVYFWVFDFIGTMLHFVSLGLFFRYVYNHHKIIKPKIKVATEHNSLLNNPERLTA